MNKKIIITSSLVLIIIAIVIVYFSIMKQRNNIEKNSEQEESNYDFYIHEIDISPGGISNHSLHYYGYLSNNMIKQYKHTRYVENNKKNKTETLDIINFSDEDKQKLKELLDGLEKSVSHDFINYYIIEYDNKTYEVPEYHEIIELIKILGGK